MVSTTRPLAIVTGASSGIGYELAKCCVQNGYDLLVAADEPAIHKVGQAKKDDPADVAKIGFEAMLHGDGDVVSGWKNKLQAAIATVTPADMLAEQHRKMAEPGSANK